MWQLYCGFVDLTPEYAVCWEDVLDVAESAPSERREVYYSGHVQGVGFRFTVQHVSRQHDVIGFVRNLPDGRVHLVAEGEPAELERFLQEVERRMAGHIHAVKVDVSAGSGEFVEFTIRH